MFDISTDPNAPKYIPGYTGHLPTNWNDDKYQVEKLNYYIPKYQGFVRGIKSENMFGKTFGELTSISKEGTYHVGHTIPPEIFYKTIVKESYGEENYNRSNKFFSFSRMSPKQKEDYLEYLKQSRKLEISPEPSPKTIDVNYDDI